MRSLPGSAVLDATLTRAGLSGVDLASAAGVLAEFVVGAAITESTWRRLDDPG